jgi:hypothetical protein
MTHLAHFVTALIDSSCPGAAVEADLGRLVGVAF